jgi:hypothetical protein
VKIVLVSGQFKNLDEGWTIDVAASIDKMATMIVHHNTVHTSFRSKPRRSKCTASPRTIMLLINMIPRTTAAATECMHDLAQATANTTIRVIPQHKLGRCSRHVVIVLGNCIPSVG